MKDHIMDLARSLAEDTMELHLLSYRMGTMDLTNTDEMRRCQSILATADALVRTFEAMDNDPLKLAQRAAE